MRDTDNLPSLYATPGHMTTRNIRYRYPLTSEEMTDTLDEVYYSIVELLGYQNNEGNIVVSGSLRERWTDIDGDSAASFGTNASGVLLAFTGASGTSDYSAINNIHAKTMSMIRNVI